MRWHARQVSDLELISIEGLLQAISFNEVDARVASKWSKRKLVVYGISLGSFLVVINYFAGWRVAALTLYLLFHFFTLTYLMVKSLPTFVAALIDPPKWMARQIDPMFETERKIAQRWSACDAQVLMELRDRMIHEVESMRTRVPAGSLLLGLVGVMGPVLAITSQVFAADKMQSTLTLVGAVILTALLLAGGMLTNVIQHWQRAILVLNFSLSRNHATRMRSRNN